MTEPKRWDWKDDVVRLRDDLADAQLAVGASRRERDRLRDERDRLAQELRSEWVALARERRADVDEARRVAGVLLDEIHAFLDGDHDGDGRWSRLREAAALGDKLVDSQKRPGGATNTPGHGTEG